MIIPGMFSLPGADPIFAEVNMIEDGCYEVGGITKYNTNEYQSFPSFIGSLKKNSQRYF